MGVVDLAMDTKTLSAVSRNEASNGRPLKEDDRGNTQIPRQFYRRVSRREGTLRKFAYGRRHMEGIHSRRRWHYVGLTPLLLESPMGARAVCA